jgi:ribosome-binding protein aMBF1 (putative translation factor)
MARVDLTSRARTELAQMQDNSRLMALTVAETVRKARLRKGWSQWELADKIDTTQSAISEWETGAQMIRLDKLMLLCLALGIPFMFGEQDEVDQA